MTIEEAITHLKDLSKCECYLWSEDIQAINIAVKALEENAELKRLLKLAVDVINDIECQSCNYCSDCVGSPDSCSDMEGFVWKHADEAMKLIGGD